MKTSPYCLSRNTVWAQVDHGPLVWPYQAKPWQQALILTQCSWVPTCRHVLGFRTHAPLQGRRYPAQLSWGLHMEIVDKYWALRFNILCHINPTIWVQPCTEPCDWHPTNDLSTTFQPPTNHIMITIWPPTNHIPTTYQPHSDHLPTTLGPLSDHLLTTFQPLSDQLPTTWPHTNQFSKYTIVMLVVGDLFIPKSKTWNQCSFLKKKTFTRKNLQPTCVFFFSGTSEMNQEEKQCIWHQLSGAELFIPWACMHPDAVGCVWLAVTRKWSSFPDDKYAMCLVHEWSFSISPRSAKFGWSRIYLNFQGAFSRNRVYPLVVGEGIFCSFGNRNFLRATLKGRACEKHVLLSTKHQWHLGVNIMHPKSNWNPQAVQDIFMILSMEKSPLWLLMCPLTVRFAVMMFLEILLPPAISLLFSFLLLFNLLGLFSLRGNHMLE